MKKSCAIGCAFLLILAAAFVGWMMTKGPEWWAKGKTFVSNAIAEEARIGSLEAAWSPPSAKPDASWAPEVIGEWKLKQTETVTGWPELNITRAGQRMIYEMGARTIEIGVVAANDLEKEVLVKRVMEGAKEAATTRKTVGNGTVMLNSSSGNMTTTMGSRSHVKSGDQHTRVWWLKDWLFFFRTEGLDAETFPEEYLKAIAAPTVQGDTPEKAEAERQ